MTATDRRAGLGLLAAVALAAGIGVWWQGRTPRSLALEAYVWQRVDSAELQAALGRAQGVVGRFHFLGVEMARDGGNWRVARSNLPAARLRGQALVLRLGSSLAGEAWDGEAARKVAAEVAWLAGSRPAELEIDYDCPQRRLGEYSNLLGIIRKQCAGVRLTITALPSWLEEPAAGRLFAACDGVILQVHSLRLPARPEQAVVLCDPAAARAAVARMARCGRPFRVALNSYGCEVLFDAAGKVVEVVAEDTAGGPPASAVRRSAGISDAAALAALVAEWKREPPPHLAGIVWYRLPLDSDRRNWRWVTWAKVAAGEVPRSDLRLVAERAAGGAWDLVIRNAGERDELLPEFVDSGCDALVLEGLNGYTADTPARLRLEQAPWPWLAPGASLKAGWLRTADADAEPRPRPASAADP